jgi:hypothetical protein
MLGSLVLASFLAAQAVKTPPPPALSPGDVPVSVDRIQRVLEHDSIFKPTQGTLFRIEVIGHRPTIAEILGPDFFKKGPTPVTGGGMTHQDFLRAVTPQLAQPYAAFTGTDLLQVAATTFLQQWALEKAITKFRTARDERERERARREVEQALAALRRARIAAGLPADGK